MIDNDQVFEAGLNALMQLSDVVGPHLNPHLKIYLSIVSKFNFNGIIFLKYLPDSKPK